MLARSILTVLVVGTTVIVPRPNQPVDADSALPLTAQIAARVPETVPVRRNRRGFLSPDIDAAYPFTPVMGSNPERTCDRLDEAGFANLDWRGAEVAGVWECIAQADTEAETVDQNSLFYLLRGEASRRITYGRLKINVPDPETSAETLARAQEFMRVFAKAANFPLPQDLLDAIATRQPATIVLDGIIFRLKPEFDDPDRMNLSIEFRPALDEFHRLPTSGLRPLAVKPTDEPSGREGKGVRVRKPE